MPFSRVPLRVLCLCACLAGALPVSAAPDPESPDRSLGSHVRGATPAIKEMIERGVRRSTTFAKLVEALNATDVMVYVSLSRDLPRDLEGRLAMMTTAGGLRYLHAELRDGLGEADTIAVAGHELQHALEVAGHPDVRTRQDVAALYARIGETNVDGTRFDTAAARMMGRRVRQELS